MEFLSTHAWGPAYEWHSAAGPDSYDTRLASVTTTHLHSGSGYAHTGGDSVTAGQKLGAVGGDKTKFYLLDNPNYTTH